MQDAGRTGLNPVPVRRLEDRQPLPVPATRMARTMRALF